MQGAGGLIVPPNKFLQTLRKICDKEGIPLIFDEVLTAWGRTGKLFGCQHSGVTPDIMGWGKSIGGGIPGISAIIAKEELMDKWAEGVHGSTFGGNPLSCRAALAAIEVIEEEKLVDNSARLGDYLMKALKDLAKEHQTMGDIRGKGLFIGIEMVKDRDTKEPYSEAAFNIQRELQKGEPGVLMIIVGPSKNILRLLPPLVIKKEEVDMVIDQLQVILTKLKL
jgi:4-aminobutyrate aminotransferase-like enzyme